MRKISIIILVLLPFMAFAVREDGYKKTRNGIEVNIENINVTIEFYSPSIVRVLKKPQEMKVLKTSLTVTKEPEDLKFKVKEKDGLVTLFSDELRVELKLNSGDITFSQHTNGLLLHEKNNGSSFVDFDDAGKKSYMVKQEYVLDKNEAIYGLGQIQNGSLQQRNRTIELKNSNHNITIPYFYSTKGYSIFWDNYASTKYVDDDEGTSFESIGDCIDYYFMHGGSGSGVLAEMRELTGQSPMFPLWTFGYWQSKERYKSQFEVVDVLKKYRELQVPIDGMIQDWRYWGEDSVWNAMLWNKDRYPDPDGFTNQIHDLNGHLMVVAWPGFGPKTQQYKRLKEKNMLINFDTWPPKSGTKPYDVYNPEARAIYWNYLNKGVFSKGVDAWWLDSTEPDHINVKPEDFNQATFLGSYQSVSNAFSLMHTKGIYEHQRETSSDKRVYILTRSSFAGQQRNAATSWSGDVVSDWDVLRTQISAALNLSVCGVPYWNSDIGGFFVWNYPGGINNVAYRELYVRWMQFGAFCPMMRSHGTDTPREIWQFGKQGNWEYDAIKKYINLRYRMLPYLYSTARQVTSHATTMMKPLVFDFINDKAVYDIDNQYMFGESFLVCPVTDPMYTTFDKDNKKYINAKEDFSSIKKTKVYLPGGTMWYDFWTGEKLKGGQTLEREAPIDIMPLYVKAGSIIPWGPDVQYAEEKKWDNLEIRIYTGADGEFVLYEDEFDNYNYEDGKYATITFKWNDTTKKLSIGKQEGQFEGMITNRKFNIVLVNPGNGNGINELTSFKEVNYSGEHKTIKLSIL